MSIAARHVEMRVMRALHEAGHELTLAQGRLMAGIDGEGTRLTDLAARAQITKQSAGFLVDQVERLGYVERVPDPTDARARLVRLAPRGREAQREARHVERQVRHEWEQHLGQERMAALQDALTSLREITDPWA
ncbi:MarR family transcriptional regulator [Nocardioides guangzhouensis]|uniref:MarR family transcriptional regulator n=2 Tax=Nocardioides guangzhouensis TaxID=2497878 RepID=A0A4Q4ZC60_9ACTN|nr:MarR family transcriptional regulator [Nocardioides guangzhouensis]